MQSSSYSAITIGAGVGTARRALGVAAQLEVAELRILQRVEGHQATDKRLAEAEQQLDGLHRLQRTDDAGQHAEHAGFGARRRLVGGRRDRAACSGSTAPRTA